MNLNGRLLKDLVTERFRTVDDFVIDWRVRAENGEFGDESAPDRATVYRWVDHDTLPRQDARLWRLSALLDIDPFCLLKLPSGQEERSFQRLYQAFSTKRWPSSLYFFGELFGHHQIWPPPLYAKKYFRRDWFVSEFPHSAIERVNYYAQLDLEPTTGAFGLAPRVFHFAYRSFGRRWVEYGVVERHGRLVRLIQINGQMDQCEVETDTCSTTVETWFGQAACEFRVASLHPFLLTHRSREQPDVRKVAFIA